jgi:hypothetical protein
MTGVAWRGQIRVQGVTLGDVGIGETASTWVGRTGSQGGELERGDVAGLGTELRGLR